MENLKNFIIRPVMRIGLWIAFAVLFFYAGLYFTEWVLGPREPVGGIVRGFLIVLFPVLVPLFFVVNGRVGCAGGACRISTKTRTADETQVIRIKTMNMPGA